MTAPPGSPTPSRLFLLTHTRSLDGYEDDVKVIGLYSSEAAAASAHAAASALEGFVDHVDGFVRHAVVVDVWRDTDGIDLGVDDVASYDEDDLSSSDDAAESRENGSTAPDALRWVAEEEAGHLIHRGVFTSPRGAAEAAAQHVGTANPWAMFAVAVDRTDWTDGFATAVD